MHYNQSSNLSSDRLDIHRYSDVVCAAKLGSIALAFNSIPCIQPAENSLQTGNGAFFKVLYHWIFYTL